MSSYSATAATRRGSFVPPLTGVERPSLNKAPEQCDVLISGTGLVESIVSAALAWQGTNVLHIDSKPHYGDFNACLNVDELMKWVVDVNKGDDVYSNAKLYIPRTLEARKYLIDLTPKILFARSDMLDLLIKSRVFQYLEFKSIGSFHTYEQDSFEKVPGSKEDIFTDQTLSPLTKRCLMRFMKFALEWESHIQIWKPYQDKTMKEFLSEQFKLQGQQATELISTIGLCPSLDVSVPTGLTRIKRYLVSLDVYGSFPILYSMYGSAGELAQAFCRSAAVGGATFKLDTKVVSFDEQTKTAHLSDGSSVYITEKLITRTIGEKHITSSDLRTITRMAVIVGKNCKEWFGENDSAAIVVFPPESLPVKNRTSVQAIVMGSGTGSSPEGTAVWYLSSTEQDTKRAEVDLAAALEKLEAAILRESTEDFEFDDVSADEVRYTKAGTPILSSVKLGQSIQNFVPREKLQYLLKLSYHQKVESPLAPNGVYGLDRASVLTAPLGLAEISYDGIISLARKLYSKVVGSDDDFFDVDFEDEDAMTNFQASREEPVNQHMDERAHDDDIGDQMEL